jgi:hypothetical protein
MVVGSVIAREIENAHGLGAKCGVRRAELQSGLFCQGSLEGAKQSFNFVGLIVVGLEIFGG